MRVPTGNCIGTSYRRSAAVPRQLESKRGQTVVYTDREGVH